ncbi:MAG: SPOR domain-containing protein [Candidatus Binatia bacterium]
MAENRRGMDKRYYFSRGQFILLGCGFIVVSVIIFFLGMLVGQGIEERKIVKPAEPLLKIPVKPAQGMNSAPGAAKEEMTFYDTLTKSATTQVRVENEPSEAKDAERTVKAQTRESKPAVKQKAPETQRVEEKPAKEAKKSPSPGAVETRPSGGPWTVQVNAFPDEKTARTSVDRLKDKGYNAYVTEVRTNGKLWYRVRVGRFSSREEAEKVEETLKNKESLGNSFATSK